MSLLNNYGFVEFENPFDIVNLPEIVVEKMYVELVGWLVGWFGWLVGWFVGWFGCVGWLDMGLLSLKIHFIL